MSRSPESPACASTLERLEAYLDRQLTVDDVQEIEVHLESCAACRAELDAPDHLIESVLDHATRSQADQGLLERLRARRERRLWATLAAASLALLAVTATLVRHDEAPVPDEAAVARATAEARYALARAGLVTRQAGLQVRDRALRQHLVAPTVNSLERSLHRSPDPPPDTGGSAGHDTDQGVNDA